MVTPRAEKLSFRTVDKDGTIVSSNVVEWFDSASVSPSLSFPGWRVRVAKCMGATTIRSGQKVENQFVPYTVTANDLRIADGLLATLKSTGVIAVSGNFLPPEIPGLRARASAEFQSNAAQAMRTFDTGSFLGEIRETAQLLRNPLGSIVKLGNIYYTHAKRLTKDGTALKHKTKRDLNDAYLNFTFGVKPLLHDVDSIAKALGEIADRGGYKVITGKAKDDIGNTPIILASPANAFNFRNNLVVRGQVREAHECVVRGAVKLKGLNNSGAAPAFAESFGFGLDQFVPTLYNLFPYSFVLDYFTNVGTFIEAATNYRATYGWSNTTYVVNTSANFQHSEYGDPSSTIGHVLTTSFNGSQTYKGFKFDRSPGIPPLTLSALYVKVPSISQIVNIASLVGAFLWRKA